MRFVNTTTWEIDGGEDGEGRKEDSPPNGILSHRWEEGEGGLFKKCNLVKAPETNLSPIPYK